MFWKIVKVSLMIAIFPAFIIAGMMFLPTLVHTFIPTPQETQPKTAPTPQGDRLPEEASFPWVPNVNSRPAFPVVVLHKYNSVVFRNVVTRAAISNLTTKLLAISRSLRTSDPIYLYLDTPGGVVDDGLQAIDTVQGLAQEVKTITQFSASMGFHMVQSMGERFITPSGVLMSHRMRGGVEGQIPGEAVTRLNAALELANVLDAAVCRRIGMKLEDYQHLIINEYWVSGYKAVEANMADKVVLVKCGADLTGTYDDVLETPFGAVTLTWPECPLINYPVAINIGGTTDKKNLDAFLEVFLHNKYKFVETYITK